MDHLIVSFLLVFVFTSLQSGFLKTGTKGSAQGNFGLMDLVAGLHWLRENLPAFNGNPNMVTLMGHGHGAALANILIVSPVASGMYLLFLHDICFVNGKLFFISFVHCFY